MILLVNDDGIGSPGLRSLYRSLRSTLRLPVLAVAPIGERSAQSHAITIGSPIAISPVREHGFFGFAVDGTPADCAKLALDAICWRPPRLVVSGINAGPNAGHSIFYSGTVGAAMEAAISGLPALAISRHSGQDDAGDAADFASRIAKAMLGRRDLAGTIVNLNLPAERSARWAPLRIGRHSLGGYREGYRHETDTAGRRGWRLHGTWTAGLEEQGSDVALLQAGHPVITLLRPDLNAPPGPLARLLDDL